MKKTITIIAAITLCGCSMTAQECDPSVDNGYFGKIGCTFSGAYSDRVEQKEIENERLRKENATLALLAEQIEDQNRLLYGTINDRAASLDAIVGTLDKLEAELKAKNKLTAEAKAQLESTKKTVGNMQKNNGQMLIAKREAELKELEEQKAKLTDLLLL